ncbi:MAG: LemA family protein [Nitriliruptor sp.]|nr:MAG: LemA family protein [Nitriliruptor sp.]
MVPWSRLGVRPMIAVVTGMGWVVGGSLVALLLAVVLLYNRLVRAKVRVRQAWAQVAVQLQRRHDLVPALVEVVRGHLQHERALLAQVTETRARALAAGEPLERERQESALTEVLGRLLVLSEQQPTLKSDAGFQQLQRELAETEDRLTFARGFANDRVARYRTLTDTFPGLLLARPFGFPREELFARESERAAQAPDVHLGDSR